MTRFKNRRIFIIPAAIRNTANAALEKHGYGPDNFSIPMSPAVGSNPPVTHYGCDAALTDQMLADFRSVIGPSGKEKDVGGLNQPNRLNNAVSQENLKVNR